MRVTFEQVVEKMRERYPAGIPDAADVLIAEAADGYAGGEHTLQRIRARLVESITGLHCRVATGDMKCQQTLQLMADIHNVCEEILKSDQKDCQNAPCN